MSSRKGFSYERDLCHRLSKWWMGDPDYDDVVFWRTPCSGGQATMRAKKGLATAGRHGDIAAVDERGKALTKLFVLEAKRGYNRVTIHDLLDKPVGVKKVPSPSYEEWIGKLEVKREALGVPYWLLIHKRDRREEMVYMPSDAALTFRMYDDAPLNLCVQIAGSTVAITGNHLSCFLGCVDRGMIENAVTQEYST